MNDMMNDQMSGQTQGGRLHRERLQRLMDAVALKPTDRVPVVYHTQFWHTRSAGIDYREAMYDYDRVSETARQVLVDLQPDAYASPHRVTWGPTLDRIGYKQLEWPGHGTADTVPFQYLDREYMKADEYEDYLFDPTGFMLSKYLPRIGEAFEGLAELPMLPMLYYTRMFAVMPQFATPGMVRSYAALQASGEEARRLIDHANAFAAQMAEIGFPLSQGVSANAPFDYFGDNFRGSKGILLDMYRRKDQLLAALDKAAEFIVRHTVAAGNRNQSKLVFIPIHWAFDSFMSLDQFKNFFWPSYRKVLVGLIDGGLVPVSFWESDCSSRLEVIADIPRGKAIYWFERTDLIRAKQVLGDVTCLRGNVPTSMLATGTPGEIDAYCRRLIEEVGKGGGFILDGAAGIPDESPPENVRAMFDSVHKYAPS